MSNLSTIFIQAQDWKTYPYHQEGSDIYFPKDEGWHPNALMEWWYTNAHATGTITGNKYSIMLSYFYYPKFLFEGIRIFNILNDTRNQFYTQTLLCDYSNLALDHLNLKTIPSKSGEEGWITLQDSLGGLKPFEYKISAVSQFGSINMEYDAVKRPLMIAETGFLYQGTSGFSYYYSQTMLKLMGTLTLDGITEPITGIAWIDHQYGNLRSTIQDKYEWFSIQLSNNMDINIYYIFNTQNELPNASNHKTCGIYISDSEDTTISNYELTRLKYSFMPDSVTCYAQQWHFVWDNIDLIITTNQKYGEVLSPFRFFEGSTNITGTVDGAPVTGIGFAELLHRYENPKIEFNKVAGNGTSNGSINIAWTLLNPDEGRPIYYDLELSTDNGITFKPIVQGLTNTSFDWDSSGYGIESTSLLRVMGYSIDSTLKGNNIIAIGTDKKGAGIQSDFQLMQNYPNPFNLSTFIKFSLPKFGKINLSVYNSLGELVNVLANGEYESGVYESAFDAADLSSGIYFCVLRTNNVVLKQKMVLTK